MVNSNLSASLNGLQLNQGTNSNTPIFSMRNSAGSVLDLTRSNSPVRVLQPQASLSATKQQQPAGTSNITSKSSSAGDKNRPVKLLDICLHTIIRNFRRYTSIVLPDELTLKLIELLNKRRRLNDETLAPLLHPHLRTLDLANCNNVNVLKVKLNLFITKLNFS
jgi:hypothetical protein